MKKIISCLLIVSMFFNLSVFKVLALGQRNDIENEPLVELNVIQEPRKTKYNYGEKIDTTGLVLEAVYSNGEKIIIDEGYVIKPFGAYNIGLKDIKVYYDGQQTSFKIITILSFKQIISILLLGPLGLSKYIYEKQL